MPVSLFVLLATWLNGYCFRWVRRLLLKREYGMQSNSKHRHLSTSNYGAVAGDDKAISSQQDNGRRAADGDDEHQSHHHHESLTTVQATISIVKAIAGAGIFALPYAFIQSGLVAGVVAIILLALLSAQTIHTLVHIKHTLHADTQTSYIQLAQSTLPAPLAAAVALCIFTCSMGVSIAYIDFLHCLLAQLLAPYLLPMFVPFIIAPLFPLILTLTLTRSNRLISFTALIGDASILVGTVAVIIAGFSNTTAVTVNSADIWSLKPTFPFFLSTAAFLFCVHFFVISFESHTRSKGNFAAAVNWSFVITVIAHIVFGVIGVFCFGSGVSSIVLQDVQGGGIVVAVKVLLCVDMMFSYAIVFTPAREVVENLLIDNDVAAVMPLTSPQASPTPTKAFLLTPSCALPCQRCAIHAACKVKRTAMIRAQSLPIPRGDSFLYSITPSTSFSITTPIRSTTSLDLFDENNHHNHFQSNDNTSMINDVTINTNNNISSSYNQTAIERQQNLIRFILVIITFIVATLIPMFSVVISFVGGLSMVSLAFIFPPLMAIMLDSEVRKDESDHQYRRRTDDESPLVGPSMSSVRLSESLRLSWFAKIYHYCVMLMGLTIMVLTVITSVEVIRRAYTSHTGSQSC